MQNDGKPDEVEVNDNVDDYDDAAASSCLGIYLNKWNLVNNLSELYEKFPLEIAAVYQCVYLIIALTVLLGWPTLPGGCQQETLSFRYLYLPLICRYIDNNNCNNK